MKNGELDINDVGKLLKHLWPQAGAHGRCWGLKKNGENPLKGSHITLLLRDEAVTVFFDEIQGKFRLVEYKLATSTEFGRKIKKVFSSNGIDHC